MDKDVLFKELRKAMSAGTVNFDEKRENVWVVVYDNVQYDVCVRYEPRVKSGKTSVNAVGKKTNALKKAKKVLSGLISSVRNVFDDSDTYVEVKKNNLKTGKQEAIAKYTGAQKRILMNSCAYSGLDL